MEYNRTKVILTAIVIVIMVMVACRLAFGQGTVLIDDQMLRDQLRKQAVEAQDRQDRMLRLMERQQKLMEREVLRQRFLERTGRPLPDFIDPRILPGQID
jgi:hypothetical protein